MNVEPYVIDVLLPDLVGHDRRPSAFLTYLFLYRHGADEPKRWSLREIAEGIGLSKRAVQNAVARLEERGLISVTRSSRTSTGRYEVKRPWSKLHGSPT